MGMYLLFVYGKPQHLRAARPKRSLYVREKIVKMHVSVEGAYPIVTEAVAVPMMSPVQGFATIVPRSMTFYVEGILDEESLRLVGEVGRGCLAGIDVRTMKKTTD